MKAAIGYLHRSTLAAPFHRSLLRLMAHDFMGPRVFEDRYVPLQGTMYMDMERNKHTRGLLTLHPSVDRFLILDDDISFDPEQAYQVCELVDAVERPIVSGVYFAVHTDTARVRPLLFTATAGGNAYETDWQFPANTMLPKDQVGMGFVCIHRSIFEDWQRDHGATWFDFGRRPNGKKTIEDEAFCTRVRTILKRPIYVHTGIIVKHWKLFGVDERTYRAQTALFEKEVARPPAASPA